MMGGLNPFQYVGNAVKTFATKVTSHLPGATSHRTSVSPRICDQNIDAIAAMVDGTLMPRPPAILASLISITFVGVGQLPKNWIRSMFRVRRHAVRDALRWLQLNNAKYYGGIEISGERLENLPIDDAPVEITRR